MIPLSVGEIAATTGARLVGPVDPGAEVASLTADSRTVGPGSLFVALAGDRVDGHRFVPAVVEAGAVVALTARPIDDAPCLVVADPLTALGRLARDQIDRGTRGGLRVVGITGSQGKTSTKDLLAQVLEPAGPTIAPVGNLNNELGVPLTVARIDAQTRYLVAEMGARGIGHIAYLCAIAPPEVGVVLNVGHAHVGEFGGRDAIARAKGELVEALPGGGVAVLNAADPLVWAMRSRTPAQVLACSVGEPPDGPAVWACDLAGRADGGYGFRLHARGLVEGEAQVEVALLTAGRHQVGNAVAAAAAAYALGLDLTSIGEGLSHAVARSRWRMEIHHRADGVTVINDAYNANPDSMRAALDTLAELGRAGGGRTVAVLGDMLELGDDAPEEHLGIGRHLAELGIDRLRALGEYAGDLVSGASGVDAGSAADKADVVAELRATLQPGDVVLVKASRGLALNTVADDLRAVDPA